jgi:mRNA interferase RelE/StbE
MSYRVEFSKQATKFIRNLQADIKDRIKEKFKEVALDPFRFLEHYEGELYKLRIGDYRALIDVDFQNKILWIRVFDKRSRIYK